MTDTYVLEELTAEEALKKVAVAEAQLAEIEVHHAAATAVLRLAEACLIRALLPRVRGLAPASNRSLRSTIKDACPEANTRVLNELFRIVAMERNRVLG